MKADTLFDALSGIDEKYIEEAAFELNGPVDNKTGKKVINFRKAVLVVLPSVAAILLIVAVAIPAIMRISKSESAAMAPTSEAASEAAAETASGAAFEATDDSAVADMEAPAAAESSEQEAIAEAPATESAAEEAANAPASEDMSEAKNARNEDKTVIIATYENGIVTIDQFGDLPEDINGLEYKISARGADGTESTEAVGALSDIIESRTPLILDITALSLDAGTYTITIDGRSAEFTIPAKQ